MTMIACFSCAMGRETPSKIKSSLFLALLNLKCMTLEESIVANFQGAMRERRRNMRWRSRALKPY